MASWDHLGDAASLTQFSDLDAVKLIGLIVKAANTARMHKKNCRQFAQRVELIGSLLEPLRISELRKYPETRKPLEQLEDALRRAYILVNSCQDRSYLYLLAMGWHIVDQFREAENEIDQYLKIVPLMNLVYDARVRERLEDIEKDQHEYTLDDEDKTVRDVIMKPEPSTTDTIILEKTLSCSYPNLSFNEAMQKETEKLRLELQRSQSNDDKGQCKVIWRLLHMTEAAAANTLQENSSRFDKIADINPSKEQWRLKVRVIRLWKQKNIQEPRLGENVEMVLLDEHGGRIQVTARASLQIKDSLKEGHVYIFSTFGVSLNVDPFKPTTHDYKIVFNPRTALSLVHDSNISKYGFSFVDYDQILSQTKESAFLVDAIGLLSTIINKKDIAKDGSILKMITFELDNLCGKKIKCTLWEEFAEEMISSLEANSNKPIIFAIQFAKMKFWNGEMGISNTKFNSRIFINNDEILEILALKGRIPVGEESSSQILSHANSTTYSLEEEFLVAFVRKTIVEIKDCQDVVTCVTLADIIHIESTSNWYYKSCNTCTTGVVPDFGIWYCRKCEKRLKNPRIRYCIQVRVVDGTDTTSLLLFDSAALGCLKTPASELFDLHLKRGGDLKKYPEELNVLKNRKIIFRVNIKKHNINSFEETAYHVGKMCWDDNIIAAFLNSKQTIRESPELQNYSFDDDFNNARKEKIMEENSHIGDNEDTSNDVESSLKRSFNGDFMEGESDDLLQHSSTKAKKAKKAKKFIKIEKE